VILVGSFAIKFARFKIWFVCKRAVYSDLPFMPPVTALPPINATALSGIAFGGLLTFFAFIGFEDLANIIKPGYPTEILRAPWC
jgi:amino acid transporter